MILDTTQLYSDDQDLAGTGAVVSENVIDHGVIGSTANPRNMGKGNPVRLMCMITSTTWAAGTSLEVTLQTGSTATPTTIIAETQAILLASLVAGYRFSVQFLPDLVLRYTRINYTRVGSFTGVCSITTGLLYDVQTNTL